MPYPWLGLFTALVLLAIGVFAQAWIPLIRRWRS